MKTLKDFDIGRVETPPGLCYPCSMRVFVSLFALLLISSCSMLSTRDNTTREVRDVEFKARKNVEAEPRKRIMVLPFLDTSTERSAKVAEAARRSFIRALNSTGRFVVISPTDFPRDVSTFILNGEYDMESMSKTGETLGLALILEGKVIDVKAKRLGDEVGLFRKFRARMDATVRIRSISTRNGREILNDTRTGTIESTTTKIAETSNSDSFLQEDPGLIEEAISKAFRGSISNLIRTSEKLSWEGRVASVQGNRIFLNAGRMSGLQVGDVLKVSGSGEEIFDPETGDLIGTAPGPMKGTLELVSYFGPDGSIAVVHSGSGFKENDLVQLY